MRYLLLILAILTFPRTAYGGPNAGGSLILHTNPLLAYSIGTDYCNRDSLLTCDLAVTTTDLLESTIVFVVAAFPDSSEPRLQAATFGLEFDEERIDISDYGSCADFELPNPSWPASGTGTAVTWSAPKTSLVVPIYWLCVTASDTTSLSIVRHPTQGGAFADDSVPAAVDTVSAFGSLGFGVQGELPCPPASGGQPYSQESPTDSDCEFPSELAIRGNHLLLVCSGSDTLPFFDETIDVDYADGQFLINGMPTVDRRRPQHADSTLIALYGRVPFVAQRVTAGASWNEATAAYLDTTGHIISSIRQTYATRVTAGESPRSVAVLAAASLRQHPFVAPDSVEVRASTRNGDDATLLVSWTGYESIDYLLSAEPLRIQPNYMYPGPACTLLRIFQRTLSDSAGPAVIRFNGGGYTRIRGARALPIIQEWQNR